MVNETYIIAMWCLWASLDIFVSGIFMVYLKVTHVSFFYRKKQGISVAVPLFDSVCLVVYRHLLYMCNICVIYVWMPIDVRNSNM